MVCPDCGESLTPVPLGQAGQPDQAFRCYNCGGFWIEGFLVNRLDSRQLDKWPPVTLGGTKQLGTGVCPADGRTHLERYTGESVPADVVVKRCRRCGWWWFGGNSLFEFKPAQEAKVKYFKLWRLAGDVSTFWLPVLAVIILAVGLAVGVELVRTRQQEIIRAVEQIWGQN